MYRQKTTSKKYWKPLRNFFFSFLIWIYYGKQQDIECPKRLSIHLTLILSAKLADHFLPARTPRREDWRGQEEMKCLRIRRGSHGIFSDHIGQKTGVYGRLLWQYFQLNLSYKYRYSCRIMEDRWLSVFSNLNRQNKNFDNSISSTYQQKDYKRLYSLYEVEGYKPAFSINKSWIWLVEMNWGW